MSVYFESLINLKKSCLFKKILNKWPLSCHCLHFRKFYDVPRKIITFDEIVAQRRAEARRSMVVQVNSTKSLKELYAYCSEYGDINGIHHYITSQMHFMLIEFSTNESLKSVLQNCSTYNRSPDAVALQSPFFWFRTSTEKTKSSISPSQELLVKNGSHVVDDDVLCKQLSECQSVSDQIQLLYDRTTLNDLGIRLRYIVARQLELMLDSLYSNILVQPFGSSVNGFGKMGCDVDLILTNTLSEDTEVSRKRLVFQGRMGSGGRTEVQQLLRLVGEALEQRAAGVARVQRILHARVPILRFAHQLADVEADLCFNNSAGLLAAELLWLFGELDVRVRPLVVVVRRWARVVGLTNSSPGPWITNFSLTLMVLFYLQQKSCGVLPTLRHLTSLADESDVRVLENNVQCTFLRDLNKLDRSAYGQSDANLEVLLLQFFEFYAQFDFEDKAISIVEGAPIRKPNNQPLYIENLIEPTLNVSRNVSFEEILKFKSEVKNAAWHMQSTLQGERGEDWGLLGMVEKKISKTFKRLVREGNAHRLVSVKDLFSEEVKNDLNEFKSRLLRQSRLKSVTEEMRGEEVVTQERRGEKIKFKNSQVAKEVFRIEREKM